MHLNGGNKFSRLVYAIAADGMDTGITRITETSGSPKYIKTTDQFVDGDKSFDVLATKGVGLIDWILARIAEKELIPRASSQSPASS